MKQVLTITITGDAKDNDGVTATWNWKPSLDMKDERKNHPAVVTVGIALMNAFSKIGKQKAVKP